MADRILIPTNGLYRVVLSSQYDNERITIPQGDIYQLICDGLVSDMQLVDVTGRIDLSIGTAPAETEIALLIKPAQVQGLYVATTETDLDVVRNLAYEMVIKAGFDGMVTVERVLSGTENSLSVATAPGVLSGSVYAMVSEWSERSLLELSDMSLDDLIYKEV